MMARLEEADWVEGWYTQETIEGQLIKERHYRLLPKGRKALMDCRAFYQEAGLAGLEGEQAYAT